MLDRPKITWVLNGLFVAGGIRYICNISDELIRKGCDVSIVYPRRMDGRISRMLGGSLRRFYSYAKGVKGMSGTWVVTRARIMEVPELHRRFVPESDFVFATAWQTAEFVNSLPSEKGLKYYMLQHYESWSGPIELVDATWRLPLRKIVVAGWLRDLAEEKFGDSGAVVVNLGVDPNTFWPENRAEHERPKIIMMYHHQPWKGCGDGLKAIDLARKHVDFDLVLFGAHEPKDDVPTGAEFHFNPSQDDLRKLYSKCDVLISPSWLEGGPMPPMEAMACGCAVVATDSKGIREYAVNGENALIVPPKQPEALATALISALKNAHLMTQLAGRGMRTMSEFTWERSAQKMLDVLCGRDSVGENR